MFQRRFSSCVGLWTLAPRARAALFELCKTCPNCLALRQFRDFNHQTVTSNNHLFLFSSVTWDADAALSSLSLSVLVMIFASFSDSLKYFHTADVFAALVHASIWSCHIIVRYNLFGLFAYSAKHWKSFFRLLNIRCIPSWIYILFLNVTHLCLYIYITNASLLSCLMQQAFGYLWWRLASKGHSTKKEVRTVFCIAISSKVLQIWFACLCAKR